MKRIATALCVALASAATFANTTIKASINGMVCAFCAQGIDRNLRGTGVAKDIYINLRKKIVVMELKPNSSFTTDKFTALVRDAGYDVTKVELVNESADSIRKTHKS